MNKSKECVDKINSILKQMEQGKEARFKLVINDDVSMYNCIAYLPVNETKVKSVYFGYALENCASDNMSIAIVEFFTDAIANPKKFNFMRFNEEPGLIQISVIDEKVYITEIPEGTILEARLTIDKNEIIKNSDVVGIDVYDCAKQIIKDIDENIEIVTKNLDDKMKKDFNSLFERLELLVEKKKK